MSYGSQQLLEKIDRKNNEKYAVIACDLWLIVFEKKHYFYRIYPMEDADL
jgi:hypothetical protein